MKLLCFFLAAASLHFEITDGRGKKPGGVSIEASNPDDDGWYRLAVSSKSKYEPILIWPYDGRAKQQDGPESIPALVIDKGDLKTSATPRVAAAVAAAALLGVTHEIGFDLSKAIAALPTAEDPFAKGVGLLTANQPADAVEPLARALKERERRLTRVPSEIYPAAMLYGRALFATGKYDDAAVAFFKALKQRPSDAAARQARNEALIRAGKPEASDR